MTEACQAYKQALPQCISSDSGLVERATFFAGQLLQRALGRPQGAAGDLAIPEHLLIKLFDLRRFIIG